MKCVYPRVGPRGVAYRVVRYIRGETVSVGTFKDMSIAYARLAEHRAMYPPSQRPRGCIFQDGDRFKVRARVKGKNYFFRSYPSHYEARKALKAGLARIGISQ